MKGHEQLVFQQIKRWGFVQGDIDGFFGLFIDNLLQLMLIAVLCPTLCGLPTELVFGKILPAAALSILFGNLFYGFQARKLALKTGRDDVTALPFGINTPSLLAYIFLIMVPVYHQSQNSRLAWQAGLFACLLSGILECMGAFFGDWVRRNTPRAALLSALAGIALTFIAMNFTFQIFALPIVALIPLLLILFSYSSRIRLPLGLPGGLVAVVIGIATAWILNALGLGVFQPPTPSHDLHFYWPGFALKDMFALLRSGQGWQYFSVILPMGLFNIIGSLQNLESAEAAGDRYETKPSLLVNGFSTLVAAGFGSPFPTTIYIGHPGWKAMGARWGYSILNGTAIALLCLVGGVTFVLKFVPLEATLGILLWIGIIITAQSFQEIPKKHALAVALGLIPALAAWALFLMDTSIRAAGSTLFETAPRFGHDLYIYGAIALSQGFLLTSTLFAAILVFVIEQDFLKAAAWTMVAALFSFVGLIHAYELTPSGVENKFAWLAAPSFTVAYLGGALLLIFIHYYKKTKTREGEKN